MIAALQNSDVSVRWGFAAALGQLGMPQAVEPLLPFLSDEAWWVRVGVAEALGQLGDARAIEPLCACLQDQTEQVRRAAEACPQTT